MNKTIALLSTVSPDYDDYAYDDDNPITLYYKKLKLTNLTQKDWSLIIAASNKPFTVSDSMREGGSRSAIGRFINTKYGDKVDWKSQSFRDHKDYVSSASEKEEVKEGIDNDDNDDDDRQDVHNFIGSLDAYYQKGKSEAIIKKLMGKYDAILEAPFIYTDEDDTEEESDFDGLIEHWKYVIKGEKEIKTWFDKPTEQMYKLSPEKVILRDKLYEQYPFLKQELSDLTEDYFIGDDNSD